VFDNISLFVKSYKVVKLGDLLYFFDYRQPILYRISHLGYWKWNTDNTDLDKTDAVAVTEVVQLWQFKSLHNGWKPE